jgi:hypothetical protein
MDNVGLWVRSSVSASVQETPIGLLRSDGLDCKIVKRSSIIVSFVAIKCTLVGHVVRRKSGRPASSYFTALMASTQSLLSLELTCVTTRLQTDAYAIMRPPDLDPMLQQRCRATIAGSTDWCTCRITFNTYAYEYEIYEYERASADSAACSVAEALD